MLGSIDAELKLVIAGNHDLTLDGQYCATHDLNNDFTNPNVSAFRFWQPQLSNALQFLPCRKMQLLTSFVLGARERGGSNSDADASKGSDDVVREGGEGRRNYLSRRGAEDL